LEPTSPRMLPPTLPSCECRLDRNWSITHFSLAAAKLPAYQKIIDAAVAFGKKKSEYVTFTAASSTSLNIQ